MSDAQHPPEPETTGTTNGFCRAAVSASSASPLSRVSSTTSAESLLTISRSTSLGKVVSKSFNRAQVSSIVMRAMESYKPRTPPSKSSAPRDVLHAEPPAKRREDDGDLFSALCHATTDDGHYFSDTDVVNHMIFLMMAAHDTTTITSTAAAYYLAKHPDWQDRARAESLRLGHDPPDMQSLERLPALDLVIKESLRLVPPVPSLARQTITDTEILGRYIPAGTLVSISLASSHFAPECWTHPHVFDPESFNDQRREDKSHRYAWMPFGGGAHKCIGLHFGVLEVKALLHEMLRAYQWTVPDAYQTRWDHTSLPVPVDGLPVTLTRR